jgi:RimJ/RimL family protein N-acetyltransferase
MDRSPPVSIPRLRTARLTLREYRADDFEAFATNLADPEATKYLDAADRRTAWRVFAAQMGLWVLHGAGWWAVEISSTGERVGNVGAFFREDFPDMEIGWTIYRPFWRNGYGSEAAEETIRYALEDRGERRVTALIDDRNTPSKRVAERCSMAYESDVTLFGKTVGRWTRVNGSTP